MATPIPANQAHFTRDEILRATGGQLITGESADAITGISTDTRAITKGAAFVALAGETHDGHAYLDVAARAGVVLALVERDVTAPPGLAIVRVPSTLTALGDLARAHTRRWRAANANRRVVAITGSAGKTTTRVAAAALLDRLFPGEVHGAEGNLNNRIGVPMVLFGLGSAHRVAVVEMGMNRPGEIAELARIAEPEVGVVTLIAAAHTELVGSIEGVSAEKGALFRALPEDGVAVGNGDDARVRHELLASPALRKHLYGRAFDADVRISARDLDGITRSRVAVDRLGGGPLSFTTPLLGEAGALACAAAIAIAELALDARVDAQICDEAFARAAASGAAGRLAPRVFATGLAVIDDTYNANPASAVSSIRAAAELANASNRRLILVLGEMRELGAESEPGHDAVGRAAAASGAAEVFAIGGDAARIAARAAEGGVRAAFSDRVDDAAVLLGLSVRAGDLVLVKGSRSIGTERVVAALAKAHDRVAGSAA